MLAFLVGCTWVLGDGLYRSFGEPSLLSGDLGEG